MAERFIVEADGFDVHHNQAVEEFLLRNLEAGDCGIYLWRNARTVVCGRNQDVRRECRVEELVADGGKIAKRLSGGGAVYHDLGNLNFSFFATEGEYDVARQLGVVQRALKSFGIIAEKTGRNDLAVDGRKFSGNAFLKQGFRRLHHGTIMLEVDSSALEKYLTPAPIKLAKNGVASVVSRTVNLKSIAPTMTVEDLTAELKRVYAAEYGASERKMFSALELTEIAKLEKRFASDEWLYAAPGEFSDDGIEEIFTEEWRKA